MKPLVAAAVILVSLAVGAPLQAQTPEIDALRARAEQGDALAQFSLGFMYDTGRGVPQDDAEAARLPELAAEERIADGNESRAIGVLLTLFAGAIGLLTLFAVAIGLWFRGPIR